MPKVIKSYTLLADTSGAVWVEAELSEAQIKRIIKSYERAGIFLADYGSPSQLSKQVEEINAVLDSNATARAFRSAGKLEVIGVGF